MPYDLFNEAYYLAYNPDVAAAVQAGLTTAYDHFLLYGIQEDRSPLIVFDPEYYLALNPDVAAAVGDGMNAVQHFLQYGSGEVRALSPFIDLAAYLGANPDVAAAVDAGQTTALQHLMSYGVLEGRDLGNGIVLSIFQSDAQFVDALTVGNYDLALARVYAIAPFLPSFQPPEGWVPAADTPIPVDFVPPEGIKLVVPPGVHVPPALLPLPDTFEQDHSGGGTPPDPYALTTAIDDFNVANHHATDGDDVFTGDNRSKTTVTPTDKIDGGGGTDTFNFYGESAVLPQLTRVEIINLHGTTGGAVNTSGLEDVTQLNYVDVSLSAPLGAAGSEIVLRDNQILGLNHVTGTQALTADFGASPLARLAVSNGTEMGDVHLAVDGPYILTIDSSGSGPNTLGALDFEGPVLRLTGGQSLTMTGVLAASIDNIDAVRMTGDLSLKVGNGDIHFHGGRAMTP